jgi:TraM recognition site of TraD and TraG
MLRVDAINAERNGAGVPIAYAPPGASKEQIAELGALARSYRAGEAAGGGLSDLLRGLVYLDDEERSSIFSTAAIAMRAYQGTARRAAVDVNFDIESFVLGKPDEPSNLYTEPSNQMGGILANAGLYPRLPGRYHTVYIRLPADKQTMYAPAVTGLLSAIKKAVYDQYDKDLREDGTGRRQPVCFALDEMYGAPLPDLDVLLSEGGGQGLLIVGALQDLSQAEARWGKAGEGFLTIWQNVVVLPGIMHGPTVDLLSKLIGDEDRVVPSQGQSQSLAPGPFGFQRRVWMLNEGETIQRQPKLPPSAIYSGNPNKKREVLIFTPNGGWQHIDLMRYWSFGSPCPWPYMLTQSCEWALLRGYPEHYALPLPELDHGGNVQYLFDAGGQPLVDSWMEVKRLWREKQSEIPKEPSPAAVEPAPPTSTVTDLLNSPIDWAALRNAPPPAEE